MNQITNFQREQSGEITIEIQIISEGCHIFSFTTSIDRTAPFNIFSDFVKDQVLVQVADKSQQSLYFKFKNIIIDEEEQKSLAELGFVNNSKLSGSFTPFDTNLQTKQQTKQHQSFVIRVAVQAQPKVIHLSFTQLPFIRFSTFQQTVKEAIFSQFSRNDYENTLSYQLGDIKIDEGEKQGLGQLGFKNNCELQVFLKQLSRQPFNLYKFRVISKLQTFSFELICHLDMKSDMFEIQVKERIEEISGLKAKIDYADKLIFKSQSTFYPFNKNQHFILNSMQANTTFDVILEPIDLENKKQ